MVNLDAIKQDKNVKFAIIRAGYGGGKDSQLVRNRNGLRARKVVLGFYFFAYPGRSSGRAQAEEFKKYVGTLRKGEFVALDIENEPTYGRNLIPSDVNWCVDFLERAEQLFGVKPLVYMDGGVKSAFNWSPVVKRDYGLWIAHWGRNTGGVTSNPTASPWPFWAIHQYTSKANMAGISPLDANRFNGTIAQLKKYGNRGSGGSKPAPKPQPKPQPKPKPTPKPKQRKGKYTVQTNDTLIKIAEQYGITWKQLYNYGNNRSVIGPNPNRIYPGQVLAAPAKKSSKPKNVYYVVRRNDYLSRIGKRRSVSVKQLIDWNKHKYPTLKTNPDRIYPGWVLRVK